MSWTYEIRVVVDIFFDTYVLNRGSLTVKNPLPLPGGIYSKDGARPRARRVTVLVLVTVRYDTTNTVL
jgi:hypothetical protein